MCAWSTWPTAVAGAVATAADENTKRDDANWLRSMLTGTATELVSPLAWGDRHIEARGYRVSTDLTTLYTVPADQTAVLLALHLYNAGASTIYPNIFAGYTYAWKNPNLAIQPGTVKQLLCWHVITQSQMLKAQSTASDSLDVLATLALFPASFTGYTLRQGNRTDGNRQIIIPTANKALRLRALQIYNNTASSQYINCTIYNNTNEPVLVRRYLSAGEAWSWVGEQIVQNGYRLFGYGETQNTGIEFSASGWEEA